MLNEKKLYTYFSSRFDLHKSTKNWWSITCPYCMGGKSRERSGAVNFESEVFKCWRAKCSVKKNLTDFIMEYENKTYREVKVFIESFKETSFIFDKTASKSVERDEQGAIIQIKKDIELPFGFTGLMEDSDLGQQARKYLKKRGFAPDQLDLRGWGFCAEKHEDFKKDYYGYVIIPFVNRGRFQYYIGRDFLNRSKKWKYKNPEKNMFGVGKSEIIYNEDALMKYKTVYLSEGIFCAETMGKSGIASLGWSLSPVQINKLLKAPYKNLMVAADKGFYKKAVKAMIPFLDHKAVKVVDFDRPALSEIGDDVNDVGYELYMEELEKTSFLTLSKALEILSDYE